MYCSAFTRLLFLSPLRPNYIIPAPSRLHPAFIKEAATCSALKGLQMPCDPGTRTLVRLARGKCTARLITSQLGNFQPERDGNDKGPRSVAIIGPIFCLNEE